MLFLCFVVVCIFHQMIETRSESINVLTNPHNGYEKTIPPILNEPIIVNTRLQLSNVGHLEEEETEYSMQFLLQMEWNDYRLKNNKSFAPTLGGIDMFRKIWSPQIVVPNNMEPGLITDPNKGGHTLVRIDANGTVLMSKRLNLRVYCKMEFKSYPFDKQECDIKFESCLLPMDQLRLRWSPKEPLSITENFKLYGFTVEEYSLSETVSVYPFTGNFSAVVITISFARSMLTSLLDVYIPTTLFVIVSWLTFWIEVPAAPARVTLGMTTMLTLVTASKSSREKLPRVAYANALDVWIFVCTLFVFGTLVEYSAVNYIYNINKRSKKRRMMNRCLSIDSFQSEMTAIIMSPDLHSFPVRRIYDEKPSHHSTPMHDFNEKHNHHNIHNHSHTYHIGHELSTAKAKTRSASIALSTVGSLIGVPKREPMDTANMVDRYCRLLFPFGFSIFNIVYWFILWSPK